MGLPSTAVLERRRSSLAEDLSGIVGETEQLMASDAFDHEGADYLALREQREGIQAQLADTLAVIEARRMASTAPRPTGADGQEISGLRKILREYDRGLSPKFDIEYSLQRELLTTGDPLFTPHPDRLQVEQLPIITPTLDSIRTIQTGQHFDWVEPPPPVAAVTVPEGGTKPAVVFESVKVAGELETDAHILDVSRQTLQDDSAAEAFLRTWLTQGVRLKQNAKADAAIAGATGTQSATADSLLKAIRRGKAVLSNLGIMATTVYANPDDAADIDIDAMMIGGTGPDSLGTLWTLRVVEAPGLVAGTAIVGAMPQAVYLCYRSGINTYLTDSGMTVEAEPRDRFSHNILGILGEGRSKVTVVQPKLLVKCTAV